jgi:hypothetical protein
MAQNQNKKTQYSGISENHLQHCNTATLQN